MQPPPLPEFAGEFETHITVRLGPQRGVEALREWAAEHGLKCLHIVLDRGVTPSQPMLTRRGQGDLAGELRVASALCRSLDAEGFPVIRVKIEAAPWSEGVPQSDAEADGHPADRYFEHHIKLLLDNRVLVSPLEQIAERHGAQLSRNALRVRDDDRHERFVTQRCYSVGRGESRRRLETLLCEVAAFGHPILEVEEEYVVYDSNLAVDAGWINDGS